MDWQWRADVENAAYEELRSACLENNVLAAPDFTKQFYADSDASDDGKGHVIFQLKNPELPDTLDNRNVISYFSKAWPPNMRGKPPYYLEADALITCIERATYYSRATKYPLIVYCDQAALQWIKTASKGAVTAWRIERLNGLNYEVKYKPGKINVVADALSRYPMIGPRQLSRTGIAATLDLLLDKLPPPTTTTRVWFWAANDTDALWPAMRTWCTSTKSRLIRASPPRGPPNKTWSLAIVIPRAERAVETVRDILHDGRSCAVLVPADLVHRIPQNNDGSMDQNLAATVDNMRKIHFMHSGMTWLISNSIGLYHGEVHNSEPNSSTTPPAPPGANGKFSASVGTLEAWIKEQLASLKGEGLDKDENLATRVSGLTVYTGKDNIAKIYVPKQRRQALFKWFHETVCHLSGRKTHSILSKYYFWPKSHSDCKKWYHECPECELTKAKRNNMHSMYRAKQARLPRSRWGMDFYSIGNKTNRVEVLGMIDLDSLWVELACLDTRAADGVADAVRDKILFRHGTPDQIHSDHAREFVGKALTSLARKHGYMNTTTGGYCPTGNSTIESFWRFLGICIRKDDKEYDQPDVHLQRMAWAWNITESDSLSCSPFQVMAGSEPRALPATAMRGAWCAPPETDMNKKIDTAAVIANTSTYVKVAAAHADHMRRVNAAKLNEQGRVLKNLPVGKYVKIYAPPSHDEAVKRSRKQKHIAQFRGPLKIIERPTPTTFVLSDYFDEKRRFRRHISNVRRWVGPLPSKTDKKNGIPPPVGTEDITTNSFIVVTDTPDDNDMFLCKVNSIDDSKINVWGYGSSSKNQLSATFKPIFTSKHKSTGKEAIHLSKPRKSKTHTAPTPWTWTIATADIDLVHATAVGISAAGKLNKASKKAIKNLKPRTRPTASK